MDAVLRNAQNRCTAGRPSAVRLPIAIAGRPLPSSRCRPWSTRLKSTGPGAPPSPAPLLYPDQPRSVKHHDLPSFLRHAERASLDPGSTTYVGTHYEYTVAAHLAALGFALRRVGGASDRGIDLLGTWSIPKPPVADTAPDSLYDIRVILQCKAGSGQRVGPHLVRELEGAFVGAPAGWRTSRTGGGSNEAAVIGLLVAEKPATKGIRDAIARSRWPMAYVCCSGAGRVQQMLWNQAAEADCGLAGYGVTLRHAAGAADTADAHIVLTWQGKPLPVAALKDA